MYLTVTCNCHKCCSCCNRCSIRYVNLRNNTCHICLYTTQNRLCIRQFLFIFHLLCFICQRFSLFGFRRKDTIFCCRLLGFHFRFIFFEIGKDFPGIINSSLDINQFLTHFECFQTVLVTCHLIGYIFAICLTLGQIHSPCT